MYKKYFSQSVLNDVVDMQIHTKVDGTYFFHGNKNSVLNNVPVLSQKELFLNNYSRWLGTWDRHGFLNYT